MARTKDLLQNLHGAIGPVVIKQVGGKTVVTARPKRKSGKKTEKQKNSNDLFKQAVAYAKDIIYDSVKKADYAKNLKPGASVYHAAMKEYLTNHKA